MTYYSISGSFTTVPVIVPWAADDDIEDAPDAPDDGQDEPETAADEVTDTP